MLKIQTNEETQYSKKKWLGIIWAPAHLILKANRWEGWLLSLFYKWRNKCIEFKWFSWGHIGDEWQGCD